MGNTIRQWGFTSGSKYHSHISYVSSVPREQVPSYFIGECLVPRIRTHGQNIATLIEEPRQLPSEMSPPVGLGGPDMCYNASQSRKGWGRSPMKDDVSELHDHLHSNRCVAPQKTRLTRQYGSRQKVEGLIER